MFKRLLKERTLETIIKSASKKVRISSDRPFVIIGEKINPTGRKKLAAAIKEGNYDYVCAIAQKQVDAGADILDVNVGVPGIDEVAVLPIVAKLVSETVDVPICLDSANSDALAAAMAVLPGKPLINSVNGEEDSLNAVLPVVKEYGASVIGLVIDDDGISNDYMKRFEVAEKILERAVKLGIPENDVIIDPLVLTVGADSDAGVITLKTIKTISERLGLNINLGASNISFGLPNRHNLNQAFLSLAIANGATCAITDSIKLTSIIRATDLIMGHDKYGGRYIKHWRKIQSKE